MDSGSATGPAGRSAHAATAVLRPVSAGLAHGGTAVRLAELLLRLRTGRRGVVADGAAVGRRADRLSVTIRYPPHSPRGSSRGGMALVASPTPTVPPITGTLF